MASTNKDIKMNDEQHQAIYSNHPRILCMAGAGAGKTFVLVHRVARLVNDGVDPKSILVLTFTNAAAFEMRERYKNLSEATSVCPEFRTFHAFCYHLLVKDFKIREKLGYTKIPQIVDNYKLKEIKKTAAMQIGCKLPEGIITGKIKNLSKQEQRDLDILNKAVNRVLKKENMMTFDILCYDVCKLFTQNCECVQKYKDQYKYIFVDEFQDTDPRQFQFVNSLTDEDTHFFFTGDALQNLYRFRNCTNDMIKLLAKSDDFEHIKMFQNYRSTTQICDFANRMSKYADDSYRILMNGQREGVDVEVIPESYADWNSPVTDSNIEDILTRLPKIDEDVAILCRSNREVDYLKKYLKEKEIEFNVSKPDEDAQNILKSSLDNEYMMTWLSTFLTSEEYSEYIRLSNIVENPNLKWFASIYGDRSNIKSRAKLVMKIRKILNDKDLSSSIKCSNILKALNLSTNIELTDEELDKPEIVSFLIEHLESIQSSNLYAGTIHSVKGLEFGTVFVMGVNDKFFKLDNEDNKNCYYVAITRAKNHLVIYTT